MTTGYFVLLVIGLCAIILNAWLMAHFMRRCKTLGLPFVRTIRSVKELAEDPTDPVGIRRDAHKWLLLPATTFAIALVTICSSDGSFITSNHQLNPAVVVFMIYMIATVIAFVAIIPACTFTGKDPPLE